MSKARSLLPITFSKPKYITVLSSLLALTAASAAQAQEAEAQPEAAPAEAAPEAEPEPAEAPVEATVTMTAAPVEEPAAPAEEPSVEEEIEKVEEPAPFSPHLTVGAGMRTGLSLDPSSGTLSLNDGLVDQLQVRPFIGGSLTPHVGFWLQFEIGAGSNPSGLPSFAILDAIAQIKFVDEFQLWVGQHIPAQDRNNMNGPFFGNTWNFAVAAGGYPFDMGARDRGFTFWGLVAGGRFKYHLSVVDLQPTQSIEHARLAGRINFHFWEPENFYYSSGTYFGTQDILTIGAAFQTQKGEDGVSDDDLLGFSIDGMIEKNLGGAGTWTAEASYFNFDNTGANYVGNQGTLDSGYGVWGPYPGEGFLGVVSWLTPEKIGVGKLQPNVRVQYGDYADVTSIVFDAGLAYVVDGFNHKYHLNYRHTEAGPNGGDKTGSDAIQVGFQYMMAN
jgi:hypothetical protein